jgi:DNA-binding NarL/FixJ family response regulator
MATLAHPAESGKANGDVRIVIADGHAMFREALKRLLQVEPDFRVIAEAKDGPGAVTIVRKARPHVVLLDPGLPGCFGLDALRGIRNAWPPTLPLLLVDSIDDRLLIDALCLGARGVALKTATTKLLLKSVRAVVAGEYWLERHRIALLIRSLNNHHGSRGDGHKQNIFGLNQRELKIVAAIAGGESTHDIAEKFSLSEFTIRHHLTNIFRKLNVHNRGELFGFALRHNLGSASPSEFPDDSWGQAESGPGNKLPDQLLLPFAPCRSAQVKLSHGEGGGETGRTNERKTNISHEKTANF